MTKKPAKFIFSLLALAVVGSYLGVHVSASDTVVGQIQFELREPATIPVEVTPTTVNNAEVPPVYFPANTRTATEPQGQQTATQDEKEWGLDRIRAREAWQLVPGKSNVTIAILDTGIDGEHEGLKGKVAAEVNFTDSPTADDIYGHGTHIAGIIAANGSNSIAGVASNAKLLNVKVADDKGRCEASAMAKGVVWAANNGANVINISIEIRGDSPALKDAIDYAWDKGAIIIAAAGNDGGQSPVYPAYYESSIAVAAIRQDDSLAPLSNYGTWVDVAAPGFNIYSTLPDNEYGLRTGTSMASAYVSGLAGLLFAVVTDADGNGVINDEVLDTIMNSCDQIGVQGAGRGCINALKAVTKAMMEE